MTRSEYQELVDFLAPKFEVIGALDRKMDREFSLVRREMAEGFEVQGKVIHGLTVRMDLWEGHWA